MSSVSLVTGATAGLGAAFARRLAAEHRDLVLVARDTPRLQGTAVDLAQTYGVRADPLPADLSTPAGIAAVEARLRSVDRPVDLLVNNAGFALGGSFRESSADAHERMLTVMGLAVLRLTHAGVTAMTARGRGDIINVSSVAGFTPAARQSATYGATKAFVTALTEGVAAQLDGTGVRLSVVAPGFVHTEFHERAKLDMSKLPSFAWLDADDVVDAALRDHRAGKVVSVPSVRFKVIVAASRLAPMKVARRLSRAVAERSM